MDKLDKKKSTEELLISFNEALTWSDGSKHPIKIGDWITNSNGIFSKVTSIEEDEYGICVTTVDEDGDRAFRLDPKYYFYIGNDDAKEAIESDAQLLLQGKSTISDISQRMENTSTSDSQELMTLNKNVLEVKKTHLEFVKRHLDITAKRAKTLLEQQMSGLYNIVKSFEKNISKIEKLIFTIQLYEGMSEEIHHIKIGINASDSETLTLRQRKLYMDEEVGDPINDGLDFQNIKDFDEWLLEKNTYWNCFNYEMIVPEEKCVVALGIRREDKQYSKNPFINFALNDNNEWCYLLIRNGENIYRIYSDLRIKDKMFPERDELAKLIEEYEEAKWDSDKDKIDSKIDRYKFNMILLQGIIERTDCYPDEKHTLSLFKLNDESKVNFLYDADSSRMLPTDILPFWDWVAKKNVGTDVGSQILWFDSSIDWKKEIYRMFKEYHHNDYAYPNNPKTGLYQLELNKDDKLFFKYDPKRDRSWKDEYYDIQRRVKRVSFLFEDEYDSYINYDNITREDIKTLEYYFHTRIGRNLYLSNIPALMEITKLKKEEFAIEDDFIKLSLTEAGLDPINDFKLGSDTMHWWKTKNKWKRTLKTDDVKALRMVIKELKKVNVKPK